MTIGEVVRTLRVSAGLKQSDLAERAGVSTSSISLVEAGRREPTIKWLRSIAPALGMSAAVLFAAALALDEDDRGDPEARAVAEQLLRVARATLIEQRLRAGHGEPEAGGTGSVADDAPARVSALEVRSDRA
jgi:transcriptional regulator with XRE-family HTH domain